MTTPKRPSLRACAINIALRLFEKRRLARTREPADLRRGFERSAALWFHGPRGTRYESYRFGSSGVDGTLVAPPWPQGDGVILYLHGGGYVMGSPRTHRAMVARLCHETGMRGLLPEYRKAPEHPFPAAIEDALAAYLGVIETVAPQSIMIGGDSAGGGLVLALLGEICRRELPRPRGCFAFSPLTDMTFSGESFIRNAKADVMLPVARARDMEAMYLADGDATDPRASPLFADFTGACPVWLSVGDSEILLDDTRRMTDHLRAQGVDVTETVAHDLPHVWPMFQRLMPEAGDTLRALARWISRLEPS